MGCQGSRQEVANINIKAVVSEELVHSILNRTFDKTTIWGNKD